jgi:hypothetical protein
MDWKVQAQDQWLELEYTGEEKQRESTRGHEPMLLSFIPDGELAGLSLVRWRDDLQRPGQWGRVESLECVHLGLRGSSLQMGIVSNMSGFWVVQDDGMLCLPVEHCRTPIMSNHSSRRIAESSQRRLSTGCLIDNAEHRIPQGPEFDTRHG